MSLEFQGISGHVVFFKKNLQTMQISAPIIVSARYRIGKTSILPIRYRAYIGKASALPKNLADIVSGAALTLIIGVSSQSCVSSYVC